MACFFCPAYVDMERLERAHSTWCGVQDNLFHSVPALSCVTDTIRNELMQQKDLSHRGLVPRARVGRGRWHGKDLPGGLGSTYRTSEVNQLLPHLGHQSFFGHQGPV